MIDDRELAEKQLEFLYSSDSISRIELIFEIFRLLTSGNVKFKMCCEKLQTIDPFKRSQRLLDVVYGLYLYLHPDTVTQSRCLRSEGDFGVQASRLVENRFTNPFDQTYLENSAFLIRFALNVIKPVIESTDFEPGVDIKTVNWILTTEKMKIDNGLDYYSNPLDTISDSLISSIFVTLNKHRVESYQDGFNFIARLKSVIREMHLMIQYMEKQRSLKGVEIPKISAMQCYNVIQGFLKIDPSEQTFMKKFKNDLDNLGMPDDIFKISLDFVSDSVYRSMYHLGDWINEFFLDDDEVVTNNDQELENGIKVSEYSICCDRNRGKQYYEYCLRHHTTTDMTPDAIHNLGLEEVNRISEEILEQTKNHISQMKLDVVVENYDDAMEYIRSITSKNENAYPDSEDGKAEFTKDVLEIDGKIKTFLNELFLEGSLTSTECSYKFTPDHQKESMPAGYYYAPSFDNKVKGAFFANLHSKILRFGLPTLVAHEAIPGHHFQFSAANESLLHPIRKIKFYNQFNAFVEGWALYAERLCKELGLYDTPLKMIGHLMDEMLRAVRLVIDTGIHHLGWDRQKALSYMNSKCPYPMKSIEIEINRYISWPGQATSYKIGQLKILESRDAFIANGGNLQEFNTKLILAGSLPIEMINKV